MLHSIIIAHRNREKYLRWCLTRLLDVADLTGGVEILIVNGRNAGRRRTTYYDNRDIVRAVTFRDDDVLFNKPKYLNLGIRESQGDVLTFLDCDALVGPDFFENPGRLLADQTITRLCYRVRYLPPQAVDKLAESDEPEALIDDWFYDYDSFHRGFEGYIEPHINLDGGEPVFGNSQFSIRRETLGRLRFNEEFVGRGFEDLWMIREIWRRHGDKYRGVLVDDADHAMFHIRQTEQEIFAHDWNPPGGNDGPPPQNNIAKERYFST